MARRAEVALLALALAIVFAARFVLDVTRGLPVGAGAATLLPIVGAAVVLHLAARRLAPHADETVVPTAVLLLGLSTVMLYRIDLDPRTDADGELITTAYGRAQSTAALIGAAAFAALLFAVRDHRTLQRYRYTIALGGVVAILLPGLLPGSLSSRGGARIAIDLPGLPSILPGEFARIALIIFVAAYLTEQRDNIVLAGRRVLGVELPRGRDVAPVLAVMVPAVGMLAVERDLGSALVLLGTFLVILYVATERVSWVAFGVALFAAAATVAYHLFSHVEVRVQSWLDALASPYVLYDSTSYQQVQSLFSFGTGGLAGVGIGRGSVTAVPVVDSDFILAAVGEELGLAGLAAVLLLYALLATRGLRAALEVRDGFGKLLAAGLAFAVAWQTFVVTGGVTGLIPLTGLTTPLLSRGASGVVATLALLALLLRVSDAARAPSRSSAAAPRGD